MVYWAKDRGHLGKRPWSLGRKTVVSWRSSADNAVPASRAHRDFKPLFACFVLDYCLNDDLRNSHAQNGTRRPVLLASRCPFGDGLPSRQSRKEAGIRPVQECKEHTALGKPATTPRFSPVHFPFDKPGCTLS